MHAPLKTRSFSNLTFLDISLCFPEEPFVLFFEIRRKTEEGVTHILNGNILIAAQTDKSMYFFCNLSIFPSWLKKPENRRVYTIIVRW